MTRPCLALVPGEPAGVGLELCVRLAQLDCGADLVALADPEHLHAAAQAVGLPLKLIDATASSAPGQLPVLGIATGVPLRFGTPDPRHAAAVITALTMAGRGCQEARWQGMVTGPVHKANINAGGIAYTGTTELLAELAGVPVVMMLATPELRVALATTHLPLHAVPAAITQDALRQTVRIVHADLRRRFGIDEPRIAVLGLNPHAGESGLLGREEIEVIEPALATLRRDGIDLIGPLPADTAFLPHKLAGFDVVLAMYHDQGLPVLKYSGFERAVNITLGLPYPRVAVDHGTALDLAGTGKADASSLIAAARLCARLAAAERSLCAALDAAPRRP